MNFTNQDFRQLRETSTLHLSDYQLVQVKSWKQLPHCFKHSLVITNLNFKGPKKPHKIQKSPKIREEPQTIQKDLKKNGRVENISNLTILIPKEYICHSKEPPRIPKSPTEPHIAPNSPQRTSNSHRESQRPSKDLLRCLKSTEVNQRALKNLKDLKDFNKLKNSTNEL